MNLPAASQAITHRTILSSFLLTILFILAAASDAHAQGGGSRAGLIIRFGDGSVQMRCISFSEPSITGFELLQRSGIAVGVDYSAGLGGAVCSIGDQGCPITDCFCRCQGTQCEYWGYYHRLAGSWQYAQTGANVYQVGDGALEGWTWGAGNFVPGARLPEVAFVDVCPAATPTTTATKAPSGEPSPTPTLTPPPLPTRRPTPTPVSAPVSVPEPATLWLLGSGLAGLATCVRGRKTR